jgi:hypothetical protein
MARCHIGRAWGDSAGLCPLLRLCGLRPHDASADCRISAPFWKPGTSVGHSSQPLSQSPSLLNPFNLGGQQPFLVCLIFGGSVPKAAICTRGVELAVSTPEQAFGSAEPYPHSDTAAAELKSQERIGPWPAIYLR